MFLFVYGTLALLGTVSFLYMHVRYYGEECISTNLYVVSALVGSFWFFGLPIVGWYYQKEIISTLHGKDWADDNIEDKDERDAFRKQYNTLHRQVVTETYRAKKAIETLKESSK